MIVCFLTMLIGIKDIMSTVYTWWQCPGRCWVVAPGSSPSPPALNYPTIHTKSGQSRQPTTVADPDPVYQQQTTVADHDPVYQQQTTGPLMKIRIRSVNSNPLLLQTVLWIRCDLFRIRIQLWIFRVPNTGSRQKFRIHADPDPTYIS